MKEETSSPSEASPNLSSAHAAEASPDLSSAHALSKISKTAALQPRSSALALSPNSTMGSFLPLYSTASSTTSTSATPSLSIATATTSPMISTTIACSTPADEPTKIAALQPRSSALASSPNSTTGSPLPLYSTATSTPSTSATPSLSTATATTSPMISTTIACSTPADEPAKIAASVSIPLNAELVSSTSTTAEPFLDPEIDLVKMLIFIKESPESSVDCLLPTLKTTAIAESYDEEQELEDWIHITEAASSLIKFLCKGDFFTRPDLLADRITNLKEASEVSIFDYSTFIEYSEQILKDAIELNARRHSEFEEEGLRGTVDALVADLALVKFKKNELESTMRRLAAENNSLERAAARYRQVLNCVVDRLENGAKAYQKLSKHLEDLVKDELAAESAVKSAEEKLCEVTFQTYQEQRRGLVMRASATSALEPGPRPFSSYPLGLHGKPLLQDLFD